MSTADNATITLAAAIGQHRPGCNTQEIATVAGKLVKTCATLRKIHYRYPAYDVFEKAAQGWLEKAQNLALDLSCTFEVDGIANYSDDDPGPRFYLGVDGARVEID